MKKVISIIAICLLIAGIGIGGFLIFRTSRVKSIEIVGDIQTIYFVDSATDVNFNDAELKITYDDGSVKLSKLDDKLVTVKNFNTSIENSGVMKILYKTQTIDVSYAVVCKGLYYLSEKIEENYNGSSITIEDDGLFVAGLDDENNDKTTSTEMIYFGDNGVCDYYSRTSSTGIWYADNGNYDKKFYYEIKGNSINVHLGQDKIYSFVACVSTDGILTLNSIERNYVDSSKEFLRNKISREFTHYEMKGNRTITAEDISVYCNNEIIFEKDTKFEDSELDIYLVVNYKNDNFLKTVYVRFTDGMFGENEFTTASRTATTTWAYCYYNGIRFKFEYKVV